MKVRLSADESTAAATEAFLTRIQELTGRQWQSVMARAQFLGDGFAKEDLIRGAVVAITVRNVLPARHFELLYRPFAELIPFASLRPDEPPGG